VDDPTEETWEREKHRAIRDLQELLTLESITVVEQFGDTP
jgi:hypothetical protein